MARQNYTRPTPGHPLEIPTEDEFLVWCESKVTQFVALAYSIALQKQREAWIEASWIKGKNDPMLLKELQTRADAYQAFLDCGYESYLELVKQKSPLK